MRGDACSVHCGYCGACDSGGETVERTCFKCGDTFDQVVEGPCRLHVWCDRCLSDARAVNHDALYTKAVGEFFKKASGE
jgi:hypothetical protein